MTYIKSEALTPIHIGTGRQFQGNMEYLFFRDEKVVSIIDEKKVLDIIGRENIEQWVGIINRKASLLDYLQSRKSELKSINTSQRVLAVQGTPPKAENTIKEYIHSGSQPLIPGSSLKGAIRTAYFASEVMSKDSTRLGQKISYEKFNRRKQQQELKFSDKQLTKELIGENPNHDYFKLLRVGDLHFHKTECMLMQSLNETKSGFEIKDSVSQYVEYLPTGQVALGRIQVPEKLVEQNLKKRVVPSKVKNRFSTKDLTQTLNQHSLRLLNSEIDKWENKGLPEEAAAFPEKIKEMKEAVERCKDNECILRLGHGSGYLSMTGDWQVNLNDEWYNKLMNSLQKSYHQDYEFPKSRRMGYGGIPFGFVKLSFLSDKEYQDEIAKVAELEEQAKREEQQRIQQLAQAREEAEKATDRKKRLLKRQQAKRKAEAEQQRALEEKLAKMPNPIEGELKAEDVIEAEVVTIKPNFSLAKYSTDPGEYSGRVELQVGKKVKKKIPDFENKFREGALVRARVDILKKKNKVTLHFIDFVER